jgi:hypothetical protein
MAAFTTIAAGIGLAATAATTTSSFIQAGKQKEAQRNAERDADEAMQAARKKLETNFYDKLSIQKEPYELEREALLSQGAQAIQAGVESERGAAATAGRIQMAQQEGQAGIRTAMGQELSGLERLSAQEDSRLRDVGVQLDLEEVAGAQLAAANAQELAAQATQQGFEGVTSMAQQVSNFAPLYEKTSIANTPNATPRQMQQTIPTTSRVSMTPTQAPQSINPNSRPIGLPPVTQYPAVPTFLQSPQQKQKNFRFYNQSTYQNPFDIFR